MGYDIRSAGTRANMVAMLLESYDYRDDVRDFYVSGEVLAHKQIGNVLWYVRSHISNKTTESFYIMCALLENDPAHVWKANLTYECDYPSHYSCPLEFLDMVPEAEPLWRNKVREYHSSQNQDSSVQ